MKYKNPFKINCNKRLIADKFNKSIDVVKIHASNSEAHEMAKARVCYYLAKLNRSFCTEATFLTGGRADIFDLSDSLVYEIINTEKNESIVNKKLKYPRDIITLKVDDVLKATPEQMEKYLS